jgi:hypothetical protein
MGQDGDLHLNGANMWDQAEKAFAQKVTFSPATGSTNQTLVTVQVKDAAGNNLAGPFELLIYLSDSAAGSGLTATTASGAVAAGASGTDLQTKVTKKALDVLTDATGKYVLAITDSAKTGFYLVTMCPGTGAVQVSAQLVAGNYG